MRVFDPDDFEGKPYVGALNQLGHVVFGAALVGLASTVAAILAAILISAVGVIFWEAYQYRRRGAVKRDFIADLIYWSVGIGTWALVIAQKHDAYLIALWPVIPLLCWLVEYLRLSVGRLGK